MAARSAHRWLSHCFLTLLLAGAPRAHAATTATWTLRNGDRLTGELVEDDGEVLEIRHAQLGLISLPKAALLPEPAPAATPAPPVAPAVAATATPTPADQAAPARPAPRTPADQVAPKPWRRQVEFGFSQQSGTTPKEDLTLRTQLDGRVGANTYRGTARFLRAETDDQTVTDRREADFRWRRELGKRVFTQTLTTYAADDVRGIDLSLEQQLGGGYRLLDAPRHKANLGLGLVVQHLDREAFTGTTAVLGSLFQDYTLSLGQRVKLTQETNVLVAEGGGFSAQGGRSQVVAPPSNGSFRVRFSSVAESKLNAHLSLKLRYEYDYDRSVADTELRAEQRITTSLGYHW